MRGNVVKRRVAVVAVGGNSLITDQSTRPCRIRFGRRGETCRHIAGMIEKGWDVVVTHGNGPQVGFILRRSELSRHELHDVPLDSCGADTQGAIGYDIQQSLYNEFRLRGIAKQAVTVVTQVLVDRNDPAFQNPTKPIGSFMDERTAAGPPEERRLGRGRGRRPRLAPRGRLAAAQGDHRARRHQEPHRRRASPSSRSVAAGSRSSRTSSASWSASPR